MFTVVVPAFAFGQKMRRTGSSNTASFGTSCSNRTHDSAVMGRGNPVDMVEQCAPSRTRLQPRACQSAVLACVLVIFWTALLPACAPRFLHGALAEMTSF